jgi:hypothetical protein
MKGFLLFALLMFVFQVNAQLSGDYRGKEFSTVIIETNGDTTKVFNDK